MRLEALPSREIMSAAEFGDRLSHRILTKIGARSIRNSDPAKGMTTAGYDCSGLIYDVVEQEANIPEVPIRRFDGRIAVVKPRTVREYYDAFPSVPWPDRLPGDLLFQMERKYGMVMPVHVAMLTGTGPYWTDGAFVHSPGEEGARVEKRALYSVCSGREEYVDEHFQLRRVPVEFARI